MAANVCSGCSVVPVLPSDFNGSEPSGHGDSATAEQCTCVHILPRVL